MKSLVSLAAFALVLGCGTAQAQISDGTIKIGVMNDMSGTYADLSGQGSVIAARMAVEDFGAAAKGMKVEILGADHQFSGIGGIEPGDETQQRGLAAAARTDQRDQLSRGE